MLAGARNSIQRLARAPVARILGILHEHFGDADDGVQRRAQFMAHIGEEPALGDRRLHRRIARLGQPVDELPKLQLAILELGDVGEHADDPAVRGPPFADLEPHAAATLLFEGAPRIAVAVEPLGDPGFVLVRSRGDDARPGRRAQNGLVLRPRLDLEGNACVHLLETAVADDQPVVCVVQRKSLGDGLDRLAEPSPGAPRFSLGALALLFQPMTFDEAVAQHRQRPRHPADLVAAGRWDGVVEPALRDGVHAALEPTQRSVDGAHDERRDAQRNSESDDAAGNRQVDRPFGIAH